MDPPTETAGEGGGGMPRGRPKAPLAVSAADRTTLEGWTEDGALRELARLASDLLEVNADEAWRRLGRLTAEQRAVVEGAVSRLASSGP